MILLDVKRAKFAKQYCAKYICQTLRDLSVFFANEAPTDSQKSKFIYKGYKHIMIDTTQKLLLLEDQHRDNLLYTRFGFASCSLKV